MKIPIARIQSNKEIIIDEKINIKNLGKGVKLLNPAELKGKISYVGSEEIYFEGTLHAEVELICVRCLNPFKQEFNIDFSETYIPQRFAANAPKEKDMELDELDVFTYQGNFIDTEAIARELLIEHIPPYPICPVCRAKET